MIPHNKSLASHDYCMCAKCELKLYGPGHSMTALQRAFSYSVGDVHARRLMWLVRAYCWVVRLSPGHRSNLEGLR